MRLLAKTFFNAAQNAAQNAIQPAPSYVVPGGTINELFKRDAFLFRNAPQFHYPVLALLGASDHAKGAEYEQENPNIAKICLANPDQTIKDKKECIPSSPALIYTEYPMARRSNPHNYNRQQRQTGFAAVLRDNIANSNHRNNKNCMKFGIRGCFHITGMFYINKIALPGYMLGKRFGKYDLHDIPLNENSIKGALFYARLGIDQIIDRQTFTPDYNFEQSVRNFNNAPPVNVQANLQI